MRLLSALLAASLTLAGCSPATPDPRLSAMERRYEALLAALPAKQQAAVREASLPAWMKPDPPVYRTDARERPRFAGIAAGLRAAKAQADAINEASWLSHLVGVPAYVVGGATVLAYPPILGARITGGGSSSPDGVNVLADGCTDNTIPRADGTGGNVQCGVVTQADTTGALSWPAGQDAVINAVSGQLVDIRINDATIAEFGATNLKWSNATWSLQDYTGAVILSNASGGVTTIKNNMADGASAVVLAVDSPVNYANAAARILSLRNNAVEKAYVLADGSVTGLAYYLTDTNVGLVESGTNDLDVKADNAVVGTFSSTGLLIAGTGKVSVGSTSTYMQDSGGALRFGSGSGSYNFANSADSAVGQIRMTTAAYLKAPGADGIIFEDDEGDDIVSIVEDGTTGYIQTTSTKQSGTITLSGGTGTATVRSGATCVCTDTTANASVKCAVATTTLTATGTASDVIAYWCN